MKGIAVSSASSHFASLSMRIAGSVIELAAASIQSNSGSDQFGYGAM
jgi:hypothetical protein